MGSSFLMLVEVSGKINTGEEGGPRRVDIVGDTCWEIEDRKAGDVGVPLWDIESLGPRGEWRDSWAPRLSTLLLTAKKWLRRMVKLNSGKGQHGNSPRNELADFQPCC